MDETTEHAGISPLGADAPTEDRVGLAGWSMVTAMAATVSWFGGLTYIQTRMVNGVTAQSVSQLDPKSVDVNFMVYGALLGVVFGAATAWALMSPIPSSYRRGGLSIAAALAGTVVAGILTAAAHMIGGPIALLGLTFVFGIVTALLARRAVAAAR